MTTLYDDRLWVHYGFVNLCSGVEPDPVGDPRRVQANGLLGARLPHQLAMVTGLHTGDVPFRVEWHDAAPPVDPAWEEVVEASVDLPDADCELSAFEDLATVTLPVTGWHRARYCASGMDAGRELDTTDDDAPAPDRYLLQLWPAPPRPDAVVRVTSEVAAYWHSTTR